MNTLDAPLHKNMSLDTPVVLIIFNRPDTTEKVFDTISQAQPKKLLVVADGPRIDRPNEAEKCAAARAIIDRVDWKCEVLTNYSETNLGCKYRVSTGLDWVFSQVEEAIIIEDDCLPSPSFFYFCQTLLERYRDDERIMHISGNNFQFGQSRTEHSYYFSKYNHIWGWASWRRAWKHYDVEMKTWEECKEAKMLNSVCNDIYEQAYWSDIFDRVHQGFIDTWDYQWTYACWAQSGLSILPNVNLITNIGFGADATHTTEISKLANLPAVNISVIERPSFVIRHHDADSFTFNYIFNEVRMEPNNYSSVNARIKNAKQYIKDMLSKLSYS